MTDPRSGTQTLEPRLTVESFLKGTDQLEPEDQAYLDDYFRNFLPLTEGGDGMMMGRPCRCGKPLGGFLGTFTYGIAHGQGRCSACGWPCVSHHYVKNGAGEEILALREFVLQVHPSLVEERSR